MDKLTTDGLGRMLAFLEFLSQSNVEYMIDQERPTALLVTFGFPGSRVEVEFFPDHIEYSIFKGDEAVETDESALREYIARMSQ
jgi:hypothetical protein